MILLPSTIYYHLLPHLLQCFGRIWGPQRGALHQRGLPQRLPGTLGTWRPGQGGGDDGDVLRMSDGRMMAERVVNHSGFTKIMIIMGQSWDNHGILELCHLVYRTEPWPLWHGFSALSEWQHGSIIPPVQTLDKMSKWKSKLIGSSTVLFSWAWFGFIINHYQSETSTVARWLDTSLNFPDKVDPSSDRYRQINVWPFMARHGPSGGGWCYGKLRSHGSTSGSAVVTLQNSATLQGALGSWFAQTLKIDEISCWDRLG